MPLKKMYSSPPAPTSGGYGGLRGLLGTGIRAVSGVASAPGGFLGAGLSGVGEIGAELVEG